MVKLVVLGTVVLFAWSNHSIIYSSTNSCFWHCGLETFYLEMTRHWILLTRHGNFRENVLDGGISSHEWKILLKRLLRPEWKFPSKRFLRQNWKILSKRFLKQNWKISVRNVSFVTWLSVSYWWLKNFVKTSLEREMKNFRENVSFLGIWHFWLLLKIWHKSSGNFFVILIHK